MNQILSKIFNKASRTLFFQKRYLRDFYNDINYPLPNKERVLIYAGIGHMYLTPLEILMYHLLKKEGYEVDYYIYDQSIPINEIITEDVIKKTDKDNFWKKSVHNAESLLKAANVKYDFISLPPEINNLIAPVKDDLERIFTFEYDGIDFGETVKGVMYRFYKSISFGENAMLRANEFLQTSLTNYFQIKKLFSRNRYKYVFFSHGIYCTWQPVLEYCKRNRISFVSYDRGKRSGTANFNINQPSPDWSFNDAWIRYSNRELTPEEEKKVDEYLSERELQKTDVYTFNSAKRSENIDGVKKLLNIDPHAKVITIFTNLIWDAANVARDIAFPSALDCIEQTIKYFAGNKNVHILIRSHPAEKVIGTRERYDSLIKERFNDHLPANVTIIEPELEINSFTVIDISDIGVVNTSTVGLEFAMLGKPVILISETHYRNKGFTYDGTSAEDYFNKIDFLLTHLAPMPEQVKLARKYFYMMMFLYQKPIPIKFCENYFEEYTVKNLNELSYEEPLYQVIRFLEKDNVKDFIFWE